MNELWDMNNKLGHNNINRHRTEFSIHSDTYHRHHRGYSGSLRLIECCLIIYFAVDKIYPQCALYYNDT